MARTHEHGMDEGRDLRHMVKLSGPTGCRKSIQGEESGLEEFPGLVSDTRDSLEELSVASYGDALRSVKGYIVDEMVRTPLMGSHAMAIPFNVWIPHWVVPPKELWLQPSLCCRLSAWLGGYAANTMQLLKESLDRGAVGLALLSGPAGYG